jgi:uncharacterized protein (TIRG00374 family)
MRSSIRTAIIVAVAAALVVVFLRNVDIRHVAAAIIRARIRWLGVSFVAAILGIVIRALRWQYLLEPLGHASFANAFRATAVGFAASSILPARAGEVIRPYFLARHENMTATGAFATIILERVLDVLTVLVLLASSVFVFNRNVGAANPTAFEAMKWAGATALAVSIVALIVMFVLAGDPGRIGRWMARIEASFPSKLAGLIGTVAEKFSRGLGAIRRPGRLVVALVWSFPLWLSIAAVLWSVCEAFQIDVPFTGSFLLVAVLVIGVAVPTPGAIGGFDYAYRLGATKFFGAPDDAAVGAAIIAHLFSIGPALVLGLFFAAQVGLNVSGLRRLAQQADAS